LVLVKDSNVLLSKFLELVWAALGGIDYPMEVGERQMQDIPVIAQPRHLTNHPNNHNRPGTLDTLHRS
jgi:hypothetical protein